MPTLPIRWFLGFRQCVKLYTRSEGWGVKFERVGPWISGDDYVVLVRMGKVVFEASVSFPRRRIKK